MFLIDRGPGPVSRCPRRLARPADFSPLQFFASGAPGVWFDPSDLATLYQDAYGVLPVTAAGQPVGLMLDKSRSLSRGPQLVDDPEFDGPEVSPIWKPQGSSVLPPALVSGRLVVTTSGGSTGSYFAFETRIGATYEVEFSKLPGGPPAVLRINTGVIPAASPLIDVPPEAGRAVFTATTTSMVIYMRHASAGTTEWERVSVREIPGHHAVQPVAAARPTLIQDGKGRWGLSFDGVDDFLLTPVIDMTATDKIGIFAGLGKLRNANEIFAEFGQSYRSPGGWFIYGSGGKLQYSGRGDRVGTGSDPAEVPAPGAMPVVLSVIHDINTGRPSTIRLNRTTSGRSASTSFGGGAFGRYPLFIGCREGGSLVARMTLNQLIVAGTLPTATEISGAESFLNSMTGAY